MRASKLAVLAALAGYHERQAQRVKRRQLHLTNTAATDLPVNSPILAGKVPIFLPSRRERPTFETPRTHHAHMGITEVA